METKKQKQKRKKDLLKSIRTGVRLDTPAPRIITPKTVYNRKKVKPVSDDGLFNVRAAPGGDFAHFSCPGHKKSAQKKGLPPAGPAFGFPALLEKIGRR